MIETVLQEKRTLDDAILSTLETFDGGCNYRVKKKSDGKYYLEIGCYGVHPNLISGDKLLLYNWFLRNSSTERRLSGVAREETIHALLKRKPCEVCGGARFSSIFF